MGGQWSGRRWRVSSRKTTEDYRILDVRYLQRKGLLAPGRNFSLEWLSRGVKVASIGVRTEVDKVILSYRHQRGNEDWQSTEYAVLLDWTSCNYGGRRAWFRCPAAGCGRRVALLYSGRIFACRHCNQLAYESQREDTPSRMLRKAEKIRIRLGWCPGVLSQPGQKPKGMRWQTYLRLSSEQAQLTNVAMPMRIEKLTSMMNMIGKSVSQKRVE